MRRSEIGLLLGSLVGGLALAETLGQAYFMVRHGHWLVEAKNTFYVDCVVPVMDARQYCLKPGYADKSMLVNREGFRGSSIPFGSEVIVALGDSVLFGVDVADDQTFSFHLERHVSERHPCLRVLNAGVPSYNLEQALARLRIDVLPRYRPRVVFLHAFNDVALLAYYKSAWRPGITWADLRWRPLWKLRSVERPLRWLRDHSVLFFWLSQAARLRHAGRVDDASDYQFEAGPLLAHLRRVLLEELRPVAARGTKVVLVAVDPFYYQTRYRERNVTLPLWRRYDKSGIPSSRIIRRYNDLLREVASRLPGVHFLDTRPIRDEDDRARLYLDLVHLSPQGHEAMARVSSSFLESHGLLKGSCGR